MEHDLSGKPVPIPHQVRGRLFRDHAQLSRCGAGMSAVCSVPQLMHSSAQI